MILFITPNPALDLGGEAEAIIPNEKSYVHNETRNPGGNAINAGRIAHRLGSKAVLTGFLGGTAGLEIESLLKKEKLKTQFQSIKGSTRINITVNDRHSHRQTRLSFSGPLISTAERKMFIKWCENQNPNLVVIGGSLPPGLKPEFLANLVNHFQSRSIPCFLDVPGPLLEVALKKCTPTFIKPNLTEFREFTKKPLRSYKSILEEAMVLAKKIPIVCVSSVKGGAILATQNDCWFGKITPHPLRSTVGAGDSMVGTFASLFEKNPKTSTQELLRFALAGACATLESPGTSLGSKHAILKKMKSVRIVKA